VSTFDLVILLEATKDAPVTLLARNLPTSTSVYHLPMGDEFMVVITKEKVKLTQGTYGKG
jgi:hypothetical protein